MLAFFGGSALLGPLSEVATQATRSTPQAVNAAQVLDTVRQTAGWTVLFLGLAVFAAALGGGMGKRKATTDRTAT